MCDNCDYTVKNKTGMLDFNEDIGIYLNKPCPVCGENLLTKADHDLYKRLINIIKWINKWFSWMVFFKKKKCDFNGSSVRVHVHDGINITEHNE